MGTKKSLGNSDICLNACFTSDHYNFAQSIQAFQGQICHGCINHDRAAYEVILLHPSGIWLKSFWLTWGLKSGPFDCEPSTLGTPRLER